MGSGDETSKTFGNLCYHMLQKAVKQGIKQTGSYKNHVHVYRPYAIDVITQITKRETDGGRKFGYYAAILSGKNGRSLRSLSTPSAGSDFTFTPRMHKISTGPNDH